MEILLNSLKRDKDLEIILFENSKITPEYYLNIA